VANLTKEQCDKLEMTIEGCKEAMAEDSSFLSEFESNFMLSMIERYNSYGDATFISPKQQAIIDRIYDKLMEE
jgi:hypothetical protein